MNTEINIVLKIYVILHIHNTINEKNIYNGTWNILFELFKCRNQLSSYEFFNKLFGVSKTTNKEISNINETDKTSEMLDESIFWDIIDESLQQTNNLDDQELFLIDEIKKLTPKEIIGFRLRTDKLLYDTYNSKMWCAGFIMNSGCSDDGFEYFRNWVISRGKNAYYKAKENPDSLINEKESGRDDMFFFEEFWYVALEAFNKKTGKDLYDFIDYDNFKTHEGNYQQFEFDWKEDNPESMKTICPKLFEQFSE